MEERRVRPVPFVQTEIYPGFPTDLQAPLMAVLTGNPGESVIQEQIFEDRFGSACQMRKMGAHIEITGNRARITGGFPLRGTEVEARRSERRGQHLYWPH